MSSILLGSHRCPPRSSVLCFRSTVRVHSPVNRLWADPYPLHPRCAALMHGTTCGPSTRPPPLHRTRPHMYQRCCTPGSTLLKRIAQLPARLGACHASTYAFGDGGCGTASSSNCRLSFLIISSCVLSLSNTFFMSAKLSPSFAPCP